MALLDAVLAQQIRLKQEFFKRLLIFLLETVLRGALLSRPLGRKIFKEQELLLLVTLHQFARIACHPLLRKLVPRGYRLLELRQGLFEAICLHLHLASLASRSLAAVHAHHAQVAVRVRALAYFLEEARTNQIVSP